MKIEVTAGDIEKAQGLGEPWDPIVCALHRLTGTRWHHYGFVALECESPERSIVLPQPVRRRLEQYRAQQTMEPCSFEAQLRPCKSSMRRAYHPPHIVQLSPPPTPGYEKSCRGTSTCHLAAEGVTG